MVNFNDPIAAAIRLRGATDGLTDLRDWDIVREYLQELEASARARDLSATGRGEAL